MYALLFVHLKNFWEVNVDFLHDPIVEEVRKAHSEHAAKFNNNIDAIIIDVQSRQKKYGARLVRREPKLKYLKE
jgi:hypothetical protein